MMRSRVCTIALLYTAVAGPCFGQEQQQHTAAQQQQAAHEQELDMFRKAFGACLEAKDYTVK